MPNTNINIHEITITVKIMGFSDDAVKALKERIDFALQDKDCNTLGQRAFYDYWSTWKQIRKQTDHGIPLYWSEEYKKWLYTTDS